MSDGRRRRERLARLASTDDLAGLSGQSLDLVEEVVDTRRHHRLEFGVADGREVDQDVRSGPTGGSLAEERCHVEVTRGVDIAPASQGLRDTDELDARLDT